MLPNRKLTVYGKFRKRRWDNSVVPEIKLSVKWLEKLGFKEGDRVNIEIEQNKLIVTLENEKD